MSNNEKVLQALRDRAAQEPFAMKMGITLLEVREGYALVEMPLQEDMENIYNRPHGGAIFSLIDEAFEIAGNSHGTVAVALNMNITYHASPEKNAVLRAEAQETHLTRSTGSYQIKVFEVDGRLIASCQALVFRLGKRIPFVDAPAEG